MQDELEKSTVLADDQRLFEKFCQAEKRMHYRHREYAIVHYIPLSPISMLLPLSDLLKEIKKSILQECNAVYADSLGYTKKELINKKTLDDMLPSNFVNLSLFKELISNAQKNERYTAEGESLQIDKHGNEKWFFNDAFLEIENNAVVGVWVRKREITQTKNKIKHLVDAFVTMIENRDPYTSEHQKRVAKLAKAIGVKYALKPEQIVWLELASLVHDIGKIAIPSELLSKPSKLSPAEFMLIKIHPEVGHKILENFSVLGAVPEIVYQHHERLDGSGYPRGLKGDEILLETKILSVADVMESMTSHRPYRSAHSIEETLSEIKNQRGVKLDPKAVDICVALFEKKDFHF